MRRQTFLTVALTLLIATSAAAQSVKNVVRLPNQGGLIVFFSALHSLPPSVQQPGNYTLFELNSKKLEGANAIVSLTTLIQAATFACDLKLGGICTIQSPALAAALDPSKSYVLGIDNLLPGGEREIFTFKVAPKGKIGEPGEAKNARNAFRVTAPIAITAPLPASVKVERELLIINPDSLYVLPETKPSAVSVKVKGAQQQNPPYKNVVAVELGQKLSEATVHSLKVTNGIVSDDALLQPVLAAGEIELGGLPSDPDNPKLAATFTSNTAVKQKAIFDLKLDFKPKNIPSSVTSDGVWNPAAAVDIGFRSTKSNNSIVLSLLYSKSFWICKKPIIKTKSEEQAEIQANAGVPFPKLGPCDAQSIVVDDPTLPDGAVLTKKYAAWTRIPWLRRSHFQLNGGPKLEADRDFKKVNILGNLRFDFNFHRWLGTISAKRKLILSEDAFIDSPKAAAGKLQGPFFGFKLVPYISFDAGHRAYSETIKKKITQKVMGQDQTIETSVFVPKQGIFRTTGGFNSSFEWYTFKIPTTLTLDESVSYLALRETVGFTTDQGAFLRQMRGFHPHFQTTLDFAIDPAGHYSFNISYENGRTAPNFEYLNKVTTGLKVIY